MKTILSLCLLAFFASCRKEAGIKITNRVSNCKLSNISYGDYRISGSPITNESASVTEIKEGKKNFPKKHAFIFYMEARGNRVLLRTAEEYQLNEGGVLEVVIGNNTRVVTP